MAPTRSRWVAILSVAAVATCASILSADSSKRPEGTVRAVTTTTVVSSANPSNVGDPVTFTATVTTPAPPSAPEAIVPTGSVTFLDGVTSLGTFPVNALGTAAVTTSALAAGPHNITAAYGGTPAFAPSTSTVLVQAVGAPVAPSGATIPTLGSFGLALLGLALASAAVWIIRRA